MNKSSEHGGVYICTGFHKSQLVARGADTQLDPNCVSAPLTTNVDLFACFAKRLFGGRTDGGTGLKRKCLVH